MTGVLQLASAALLVFTAVRTATTIRRQPSLRRRTIRLVRGPEPHHPTPSGGTKPHPVLPRWLRSRAAQAADPQLPLAAELVAACLAAGAGPAAAAAAAGDALAGPIAGELRRAARELRLGGEPAVSWGRLAAQPGAAPLARRLELADSTGIPAVAAVTAAAADERAARARRARTAIQRAGVHITGPLGLCFLPAFLLIGVAPVVIGLAGPLL